MGLTVEAADRVRCHGSPAWSLSSVGKYLFTQDVGVPAVVGQLAQDLQVHPAHCARITYPTVTLA